MNRKDAILRLRQVLISQRDALRRARDVDLDSLRAGHVQHPPNDMADDAAKSAQHIVGSELVEEESRKLAQIGAALERMRNGTYGVCPTCDTNILLARLEALPYAPLCIRCQQDAEREPVGEFAESVA